MTNNENLIYKDTGFVIPSTLKNSIHSISMRDKCLIIKLNSQFQNIEIKTDITSDWTRLKENIKNKLHDYKINDIEIIHDIFKFLNLIQDKIIDKSAENGNKVNKRNHPKCCGENCIKPVTNLLVSINLHVNGGACDSCKKEFDEKNVGSYEDNSLKNNNKELKIKNIKFNENEEYEVYTTEFPGQLLDELDMPYLEWIKIYD